MRSFITLAVAIATAVPAVAANRLTDKEVKALVAKVEDGRDRFDDALDGKLKNSILRGPGGEVDVDRFLNDFQESIDRLEERLAPGYAASQEAQTVLRQATAIDRFFREQPGGTKGESEWNRLAADLQILAAAYGTGFPLAENAAVRRMGDREVAATLEEVAKAANRLGKTLDADLKRDAAVDKPTREGIVDEARQLEKDAKAARNRVKDGKPSSAEADQVLARAATLQTFIAGHQVPGSAPVWSDISGYLRQIGDAYHVQR
jgi:hypothetical protein